MSGSNILTDMPLTSDRDRSALLRYDDHQRIGRLRSAESRAVPHAELHRDLALGRRQHALGCSDPSVGNDDRSVVQRRILEKVFLISGPEISASIFSPFSMIGSRLTARAMTISAPVFVRAISALASTTVSIHSCPTTFTPRPGDGISGS